MARLPRLRRSWHRVSEFTLPEPVGVGAIGLLAEMTPARLSYDGRIDAVAALDAQLGWLASVRAGFLASLAPPVDPDGGAADKEWVVDELALASATSCYEAAQRLHTADALRRSLPATASALAAGRLSWEHAVALARETRELDIAQAGQVERAVLADRTAVTPGQTRAAAKAAALALIRARCPG